jgi:hypothetical protein
MNKDEIIRMTQKVIEERGGSRMDDEDDLIAYSLQLAALVVAAERERCGAESFKALVGKGVGWEIRQLVSHAITGPK